jgi:hypothetical protein
MVALGLILVVVGILYWQHRRLSALEKGHPLAVKWKSILKQNKALLQKTGQIAHDADQMLVEARQRHRETSALIAQLRCVELERAKQERNEARDQALPEWRTTDHSFAATWHDD